MFGFVWGFGLEAWDGIGFSYFYEIGVPERRVDVVFVVKKVLPLTDHAEESIIEDDDLYGDVILGNRAEFLNIHLDASVSRETPGVMAGEAGSHSGWEREAHGAESSAGEEFFGFGGAGTLSGPHFVLADVDDENVVGG